MNKSRQLVVFRWAIICLIIMGVAGYLNTKRAPIYPVSSVNPPRLAPLPTKAQQELLSSTAEIMPLDIDLNPETKVLKLFKVTPLELLDQQRETLSISMLFFGKNSRYAIINGKIVHEGEIISDGKVLAKVNKKSIVVTGGSKPEVIEWVSPGVVRLN
ncbi:MAG: hypothetical protein ACNI27_05610 [Desulfovibrio sp.]